MQLTEIEYDQLAWYDVIDVLDAVKTALAVPHRLRPSWEQVVKYDLLKPEFNEPESSMAQYERITGGY